MQLWMWCIHENSSKLNAKIKTILLTLAAPRGIEVTIYPKGVQNGHTKIIFMIVFKLLLFFFYLVHYKRKKSPKKASILYSFCVIFFKRDPVWSKSVIELNHRIHPPVIGNLGITGKLLVAQRFMIAHWEGIAIVIILSIKKIIWYSFKAWY